uniref:Protein WUSCHEL-like n=1 Tax=Tanacetum cinerariifolium TaxID=118510 RepID=A0A6L2P0Y2_TANCI|nr:protein WUSCHEL-like [Tanacetum cinerariifolium]
MRSKGGRSQEPRPALQRPMGDDSGHGAMREPRIEISENSFEVLKILENSLEVLKVLENNLKSMKLQENWIISAFVVKMSFLKRVFGGSIWRDLLAGVSGGSTGLQDELVEILDQDRVWELVHFCSLTKSSPKGMRSHRIIVKRKIKKKIINHDFFGLKASDLSSDHSVGGYYTGGNWYRVDGRDSLELTLNSYGYYD